MLPCTCRSSRTCVDSYGKSKIHPKTSGNTDDAMYVKSLRVPWDRPSCLLGPQAISISLPLPCRSCRPRYARAPYALRSRQPALPVTAFTSQGVEMGRERLERHLASNSEPHKRIYYWHAHVHFNHNDAGSVKRCLQFREQIRQAWSGEHDRQSHSFDTAHIRSCYNVLIPQSVTMCFY